MAIDCYEFSRKEIFLLENINYDEKNKELVNDSMQKLRNITKIEDGIPLITHQVYLTSKITPQQLENYNLRKTITSITSLNSVSDSWEHIIWTNDKDIIPQEIKNLSGVKIHLIEELNTSIIWDELALIIEQAESNKAMFAKASDFIRYAALDKFGGIYRDLDYEIIKPEEFLKLTESFHFFGGKEFDFEPVYIGSALIGATKNHPVINGALEIIKRNSNNDKSNLPEYLQYPCNKINQQIYETGPAVITMAFYKFANQYGYRDLLLPANIVFNWNYARSLVPDSSCYIPSLAIEANNKTIGYDMFCGAWHKNKGFFDRITYSKNKKTAVVSPELPKGQNIDCYHGLNKEIFAQEGIDFDLRHLEISKDNLHKIAHPEEYAINQSNPIPTISHCIYFTSQVQPKEMGELPINKTISSINRLNEINDNWKHFFWTNDITIIPHSITNIKNVEIHLISELKDSVLWDQLNSLLVAGDIDHRALAGASDLVRYMALEKFGGVYRDADYEIFSAAKLYSLMQAFNFLGGKEFDPEMSYMGNSFVASISNHPIIKTTISQIERNLITDSSLLPKYLQYPCAKFSARMYTTGPALVTLAFYKSANKDGNIDLLALPGNIFFNTEYIHYVTPNTFCSKPNNPVNLINDINGTKIETIGADMWCVPWPTSYFEPIYHPKNINGYLYFVAQNGDLNAVQEYVNHGADINAPYKNGFTPLYMASQNGHEDVVQFLVNKGAKFDTLQPSGDTPLSIATKNRYFAIVELFNREADKINDSAISCYANEIDKIFAQEGFDYNAVDKILIENYRSKIKELDMYASINKSPIPFKTHQIYFTSKKSSQTMDDISLNKTITTIERLNKEDSNWQHFLWTDNINSIPGDISSLPGVEVHLIEELNDSILWDELQLVLKKAESDRVMFAQVSDIARLMALYEEGGIYRDLDNEIYRAQQLIKLINAYNFIGGKESNAEQSYIGNAFIASIPKHIIIETAIDLIKRNLNTEISSLPEYLQYPCNKGIKVIYDTGSPVLTTAYYMVANQDGNIDIVAPGDVFFNTAYALSTTPASRCHKPDKVVSLDIGTIAGDPFCGSWQSLERIYYAKNKNLLLYQAAETGDLELLNKALNDGANVNKIQSNDATPLCIACHNGKLDIVRQLLNNKANTEILGAGHTPLYWATQGGHINIVKMLIAAKADVNAEQDNGASILFLAVNKRLAEIIELLLNAGADTHATFNGKTPISWAEQHSYSEIRQLLLNNELFRAAVKGDYNEVIKSIDLGADVNSLHIEKATSLYIASKRGYEKIVELLIQKGAKPDLAINNGDTPLYVSASEGHTKVTKLLLDAGANKEVQVHNYTPLLVAAHFERVDDVNLLLEYGANILSDNAYTVFNVAQFKQHRTEKGNIIYQNILNHYLKSLETKPVQFEVVIARYNETLEWVTKEFPTDKIVVYNKGEDDLKLPHNFQIIPLKNTGRESHTYLHHIIENYNNLAERTLFLQGDPYEHPLFLPLAKYKESPNSICTNIIAKCTDSHPTLTKKANNVKSQLEKNYKNFKARYDLIEFTHKFIDKNYDPNAALYTINGAQFAVEKQNILSHNIEYYQALIGNFANNVNPVEGFYLERLWDIIFAPPAKNISDLNQQLLQAAWENDDQEASKLLDMGAEINSITTNEGATALYLASWFNHFKLASLLIARGADVNIAMKNGNTPLYAAVYHGHEKLVRLLVQYGAEVYSDQFMDPLALAARLEREETDLAARLKRDEIHRFLLEQYWIKLKQSNAQQPNCTSIPADNEFEVVIVRYNEDISWIKDEFPCEKITIYNKGSDDLPISPYYTEVKLPNVGYLEGAYMHHIITNYDTLPNRVLFLQANPYDAFVFLPLSRHKGELNSTCQHIIGKCEPGHNLQAESLAMQNFDWQNGAQSKYKLFNHQGNDLMKFVHEFIGSKLPEKIAICYASMFAVDKEVILNHKIEYYQNLSSAINYRQYPIQSAYFERLWDLVFASPTKMADKQEQVLFEDTGRNENELLIIGEDSTA